MKKITIELTEEDVETVLAQLARITELLEILAEGDDDDAD
jgi:Asp-tRNA(Asn)/Glu-tRNA(Gln) amidotransferase C subunit